MFSGIFAGITWALETVFLGLVLGLGPFLSTKEIVFLAPFIATFFHDFLSSAFLFVYHGTRRNLKELFGTFQSKSVKWLILASAVGGPVGMTGYVMAVNYMGASVGAVASAVYPAIGTVLAFFFLKEKVKWYQWLFLAATLLGVYGLSYSPSLAVENFWLGILGAFMCAFGWGVEAVILAKCFRDSSIKNEYALWIRQSTSFLIYGLVILPVLGGWRPTLRIIKDSAGALFPLLAVAALFATVSYTFYYRAIAKIGASKAMALNITYTAWAILFAVLILGDFSVLNPLTLLCASGVVVFGILSATNLKQLFGKNGR